MDRRATMNRWSSSRFGVIVRIWPGQGRAELRAAEFRFDVLLAEGLQTPRSAIQRRFLVFLPVHKRKNRAGTNAQNGKAVRKRKNRTASIAQRPFHGAHPTVPPHGVHSAASILQRPRARAACLWRGCLLVGGAAWALRLVRGGVRPAESGATRPPGFAPCARRRALLASPSRGACRRPKIPKSRSSSLNVGLEQGI